MSTADCVKNFGLLEDEGFNAAAELAFNPGSPAKIQDGFGQLLDTAAGKGHRMSVTTAVEMTAVMDIPGEDIEAKIEIQNEYREALVEEGGWIYGSHQTCYIAAKLAAKYPADEDSIVNAVREHHELELACMETGRKESVQLGYAALILMDAQSTPVERAQKFTRAFKLLKERGFENKTRLYPTAAHMVALGSDLVELTDQFL